jgi:hypothetical protein
MFAVARVCLLAFSPDARHLYVAFQDVGIVYDATRDDRRSFKNEHLSGSDDSPPGIVIAISNGMRVRGSWGVVLLSLGVVLGMRLA